jgi:nucleoside-diphosphate-sugar epimerase
MKRVIISGSTGAIGMALLSKLINENVEILVLCRRDSKRTNQIPDNPLIYIDYCNLSEFGSYQNTTGKSYDVFYHFAWDGTFGNTRNDMYLQNKNVKYALDAVQLAKRFGCKTFIGAGSQAEYGRVEAALTPDTPTFPENGYGIAKLCAGQMTRILCQQLGIKHIWVRILSIYGPYDGVDTMIMSTIHKLLRSEVPKFTKCDQIWDYLYSDDAANAFFMIANHGSHGKTYVLGSGEEKPLKEYIYELRDSINPMLDIDLGAIPYNDNQVMYLSADIDELKKIGFIPSVGFKEGIKYLLSSMNKKL